MKISIYNPTGSRVSINGNGAFSGIVIRSLFATHGHQEFEVTGQEHADWLIRHIQAACPSAQIKVIGDVEPSSFSEPAQPEPEVAIEAAIEAMSEASEPKEEPAPIPEGTIEQSDSENAESATKKTGGKKSKAVTETKE